VGSVFTVKLPLQPFPSTKLSKAELPKPRQRIVLVEPNEETANLICDLLLAADYQVVWVLEGLPALSQIEVLSPAAVIVSLRLPDIDSHHLIHNLRQNPVTKQVKILALAARATEATEGMVSASRGSERQSGHDLEHSAENHPHYLVQSAADEVLFQPLHPEILLQKLQLLVC
jgi:CheY-like chemotaxis protein